MRWTLSMLAILVPSVLACGCGERRARLGSLPRGIDAVSLNRLVVTLDTTRSDRISCYGTKDVETPGSTSSPARGVRFGAAVSPIPLTLPAHRALFTSLL